MLSGEDTNLWALLVTLVFVAMFMTHQLGDVDLQGSYSCLLLSNDPLLVCGIMCQSSNGALHVIGGMVFAL